MIDQQKIISLLDIRSENRLISSLYLDLTGGPKKFRLVARKLIRDQKDRLYQEGLSDQTMSSLNMDFERIKDWIDGLDRRRRPYRGLSIFSFAPENLWEIFFLPRPVQNALFVGHQPQISPLIVLLGSYRKIAIVLLSKDRARILEYFMGEHQELPAIASEVPDKVKKAGYYGREERGIERHIKDHVRTHLKTVATRIEAIFRKRPFDWLLIGSTQKMADELNKSLSTKVSRRVKTVLSVDLDAPDKELMTRVLQIEEEIKDKEDRNILNELFDNLGPSGLGVTGISETLYCLYQGDARILLVEEGFTIEGGVCAGCGFLTLEMGMCPICRKEIRAVSDVIAEAIALAVRKNCKVVPVQSDFGLQRVGHIGTMLRYKR
jgi:hypothetical protein